MGEAKSWAELGAGCDAGGQVGSLQSSGMARPLYEKTGQVGRYLPSLRTTQQSGMPNYGLASLSSRI